MSGCAGADPDVYTGCTGIRQGFADFISRCSGSEDVVNQYDMPAIQALLARKDFDQIFPAFSCAECGLSISISELFQK
jgi:hypothetical protein